MKFCCIYPRDFDKILDELCFILERRMLFAVNLTKMFSEKLIEEDTLRHIIGCVEFLIAETLARLLNVKIYFRKDRRGNFVNISDRSYIFWNGYIQRTDDVFSFNMSDKGLPDIEFRQNNLCTLVEVTLGTDIRTILYEINEVIKHTPTIPSKVKRRLLIAPLLNKNLEEVREFVKNYIDIGSASSEIGIVSLYTLVKYLDEKRQISDLNELLTNNDLSDVHSCEDRIKSLENVFVRVTMERNIEIEALRISNTLRKQGYIVIPSILTKLASLIL